MNTFWLWSLARLKIDGVLTEFRQSHLMSALARGLVSINIHVTVDAEDNSQNIIGLVSACNLLLYLSLNISAGS